MVSLEKSTIEDLAEFIGECADKACKVGIGALTDQMKSTDDGLIKRVLGEVMDGADPGTLRKKTERQAESLPHSKARKVRMFAETFEALQLGRRPEQIREMCEKWIKGA